MKRIPCRCNRQDCGFSILAELTEECGVPWVGVSMAEDRHDCAPTVLLDLEGATDLLIQLRNVVRQLEEKTGRKVIDVRNAQDKNVYIYLDGKDVSQDTHRAIASLDEGDVVLGRVFLYKRNEAGKHYANAQGETAEEEAVGMVRWKRIRSAIA